MDISLRGFDRSHGSALVAVEDERAGDLTLNVQPPVMVFVTPYSPVLRHGHAADDIASATIHALAEHYQVHVFAPLLPLERLAPNENFSPAVTIHHGSPPNPTFWRFFGFHPASSRKDWSRKNAKEVDDLIRSLKPDHVHVEYLQPGVPAAVRNMRWSLTLHDIGSVVFRQRYVSAKGIFKAYRWLEFVRVQKMENAALKTASVVFTLSNRDAILARRVASNVVPLAIGSVRTAGRWTAEGRSGPVFVFAGAMWRDANARAAEMLIEQVMPIVWKALPDAELRIVGARPPQWLLHKGEQERIVVAGFVESLDREYLNSSAVIAPSLVDAGVLLKALRALALGVPLIVNSTVAEPIGLKHNETAWIEDTASDLAKALVRAFECPERALAMGRVGFEFIEANYSWTKFGHDWIEAVEAV